MSSKKALIEASYGVAASLITLFSTYPIEVLNTNRQTKENDEIREKKNQKRLQQLSRLKFIVSLFRGLHVKAAFTILSNFTYFYLDSYVKNKHQRYVERRQRQHSSRIGDIQQSIKYQPSIATQMTINVVTAMMTVFVGLPLESIAFRSQVKRTEPDEKEDDSQYHTSDLTEATIDTLSVCSSSQSVDTVEGPSIDKVDPDLSERIDDSASYYSSLHMDEYEIGSCIDNDTKVVKTVCGQVQSKIFLPNYGEANIRKRRSTPSNIIIKAPTSIIKTPTSLSSDRRNENNFLWLWKGLVPSLLLTANPAINFTVFDTLKDMNLRYKRSRKLDPVLRMPESFMLGIIAKFFAIIATYPLIRTKMILVVANQNKREGDDDKHKHKDTVTRILKRMYIEGGIKEMYKGCGMTLLLTLVRSAIFMMARDKLTQ